MRRRLRSEEIYDALLDDEALARLPHRMAESYSARSCVLHWQLDAGRHEIVSHNEYYSDEQMADYANNFTGTDLWSIEGARPENRNRVWNCEVLVPPRLYERSEFYNEWIREMGDDTFYCLETALKTGSGMGFVGLHRGRTQSSFSERQIRALEKDLVHLRRMYALKGRLRNARDRAARAEAVLDQLGDAFLVVTGDCRVVHANAAAEAMLRRLDCLFVRRERLGTPSTASERALGQAVATAADPVCPCASAVMLARTDGGMLEATVAPIHLGGGVRRVMVSIRDPAYVDTTLETRIAALHGLTAAEAAVAVRLAAGESPTEIAEQRGVTVGDAAPADQIDPGQDPLPPSVGDRRADPGMLPLLPGNSGI